MCHSLSRIVARRVLSSSVERERWSSAGVSVEDSVSGVLTEEVSKVSRHQEVWLFEPNDLHDLEEHIAWQADKSSDGFPAFVDPEPVVTKGRFGRRKEQDTGFGFTLAYNGEAPGSVVMMVDAPDIDVRARLVNGDPALPEGWSFFREEGYGVCLASDGLPDAPRTAKWMIDALVAFGAPFRPARSGCTAQEPCRTLIPTTDPALQTAGDELRCGDDPVWLGGEVVAD